MRGLTIIVAGADADRLHAVLTLACAQAATGGRARVFLQGEAASLLREDLSAPGDAARIAAGLPALSQIIAEALAIGVTLIACQTGLALAGLDASALDQRITTGGLVSLLNSLNEDRLVMV